MRQGYCYDYYHYLFAITAAINVKNCYNYKTNFYSLFKNVVKVESHTLHSCKGQRKFIALLCKMLSVYD